MKRRTFILTATGAMVAIASIPIISYKCGDSISHDPLIRPEVLAHFCDEKTIREIGVSYRAQFGNDATKEKLTKVLLTDDDGKKINPRNRSAIFTFLEEKIQHDFLTEQIIVINGWVISLTEARQCALYSFT